MARPTLYLLAALALPLLPSCSSTSATPGAPELRREPAPDEETRRLQQINENKRRNELPRVLLDLDKMIDGYVSVLSNAGTVRSDNELQRIDKALRQKVKEHRDQLLKLAADSTDRDQQALALAALGFAEGDVLSAILQGAQLQDDHLVDRAVLGLAVLKDPRTPPGVLVAIMNDATHPEAGRIQASWALYVLQENRIKTQEIAQIWRGVLDEGEQHPLILANAVRGMGLLREDATAEDRALIARYVKHPVAMVRWTSAIALGRTNAQDQVDALLKLLGPAESIANVRLAARKALQSLAGGTDRGYDIELWRKEFARGAPANPVGTPPAKTAASGENAK